MIKRQYRRFDSNSYFNNFIAYNNSKDGDASIEDALKPYNATLGKTKAPNYKLNVKWHDPKQYVMFVLTWS